MSHFSQRFHCAKRQRIKGSMMIMNKFYKQIFHSCKSMPQQSNFPQVCLSTTSLWPLQPVQSLPSLCNCIICVIQHGMSDDSCNADRTWGSKNAYFNIYFISNMVLKMLCIRGFWQCHELTGLCLCCHTMVHGIHGTVRNIMVRKLCLMTSSSLFLF